MIKSSMLVFWAAHYYRSVFPAEGFPYARDSWSDDSCFATQMHLPF